MEPEPSAHLTPAPVPTPPSATPDVRSEPYPHHTPPPGVTLDGLLNGPTTRGADGSVHLGKLTFDSEGNFQTFRQNQERLAQTTGGATPDQVAALHEIITTGNVANRSPIQAAPKGTTPHELLTPSSSKPDANGFYHFGQLSVQADLVKDFTSAQKFLMSKDPEAMNALYHLEHGGPASIVRVSNDDFTMGRTVYWDPTKAGIDPQSGMKAPASITLLHEETHALGGIVGNTLHAIDSARYTTYEEKRVIDGVEKRAMDKLGLTTRSSHNGELVDAPNVNSIDHLGKPQPHELHVGTNGKEHLARPGYQQTGRIVGLDETHGTVTIATGRPPTTTYRMSELVDYTRGGDPESALRRAAAGGENITISLDRAGQLGVRYQEVGTPAQQLGQSPQTPGPVPGSTPSHAPQYQAPSHGLSR